MIEEWAWEYLNENPDVLGREQGVCRDDRDLTQHFLRPIAKELGFYWKGFGFRSLRREAITAIGSVAATRAIESGRRVFRLSCAGP